MKKIYTLLITVLILNINLNSQEYIFKFKISKKEELTKLTKLISIDNFEKGIVTAYANKKEFEVFKTLDYNYELLPNFYGDKTLTMATTIEEMENWDKYPTHDLYIQMMDQFASDYPSLCIVDTIGTSEEGRPIKVVKITDNPDVDEEEPEFFYTGTMHGDELAGYVLLLRLIDYLLTNYNSDSRVTYLVNNFEIWINPLANPDGTFAGGDNTVSSSTRSNSNSVDLNRNFPTPNLQNPGSVNEKEIQAMIRFAEDHHFVFSANTHGGAEVVNYPWDSWYSSTKKHSDHNWFDHVSHNYADSVHIYSPTSYLDGFDDGVTHGADWYLVDGSRQDHMTYFQNCREITLELSNSKRLDCENLPAHWNYNRSAFLGFIEECLYGFNGTVKNTNSDPLDAKIEIISHDTDNSEVYTDPAKGDYYRPIEPGTYSVHYSSTGYTSQQHIITVSNWETTTVKNIVLKINPDLHTISGAVTEDVTGNPIENVQVEILDYTALPVYTDINGEFTINDVEIGSYFISASKENYSSETQIINMTGNNETVNFILKPNIPISGVVTDKSTGNPVQGAEVKVINTSLPSVLTDISGQYFIDNVPQTSQQIKVCKLNYYLQTVTEEISNSNHTFNFMLSENDAVNFETEIPEEFNFGGSADWTRELSTFNECIFGNYAMKSGTISHGQTTEMSITKSIISGDMSFYKKISSEGGYDFLRFYIDDVLQNSWSGEINWEKESYELEEGSYTFKWSYSKDGGVSSGEDAVWVDLIEFPSYDSTEIIELNKNLLIYPNPNEGEFNVKSDNIINKIILTDVTGRFIKSFSVFSNFINITMNEKGIYIMSIITSEGTYFKKIIIR